MPNENCCVNAVVSSSDPCCASTGSMWWDRKNNELKIMDWWWITITSSGVDSVNWKKGKVQLTAEDIFWSIVAKQYYLTGNWRTAPATSLISWSDSLITSGAVYDFVAPIRDNLINIQSQIGQVWTKAVLREDVDMSISPVSLDTHVPTSKAVYQFLTWKTMEGVAPIQVSPIWDWSYRISVSKSNKLSGDNGLWVCRLATTEDYDNASQDAALTPDVIKPLIDDLITKHNSQQNEINTLKTEVNTLKTELNQQKITMSSEISQLKIELAKVKGDLENLINNLP